MPPKRHRYFYGAFPVVARGSRFRGKKVQNLHFTPTTGAAFLSSGECRWNPSGGGKKFPHARKNLARLFFTGILTRVRTRMCESIFFAIFQLHCILFAKYQFINSSKTPYYIKQASVNKSLYINRISIVFYQDYTFATHLFYCNPQQNKSPAASAAGANQACGV